MVEFLRDFSMIGLSVGVSPIVRLWSIHSLVDLVVLKVGWFNILGLIKCVIKLMMTLVINMVLNIGMRVVIVRNEGLLVMSHIVVFLMSHIVVVSIVDRVVATILNGNELMLDAGVDDGLELLWVDLDVTGDWVVNDSLVSLLVDDWHGVSRVSSESNKGVVLS